MGWEREFPEAVAVGNREWTREVRDLCVRIDPGQGEGWIINR